MRDAIERRIAEFLAPTPDKGLQHLRSAVERHGFLPLYVGWTDVLGIQPDGSFVRWNYEGAARTLQPLRDSFWRRMAIIQGARRFPELAVLIPVRTGNGASGGLAEPRLPVRRRRVDSSG